MSVIVEVRGEPIAQPRQRHTLRGGFVKNYTPANHPVNDYKAAIKLAWMDQGRDSPVDGPVQLRLVLTFSRPKSMLWKKRPMPRCWHTQKPDADNVAKAVKDALNGVAWRDDSQVCRLIVEKWIADGFCGPSTVIEVDAIEGE